MWVEEQIAESEVPIGFNYGVAPIPILELPEETLAALNGKQLTDLVEQHIWNIRPRALVLRQHTIIEGNNYTVNEAAGALFMNSGSVYGASRNCKLRTELKQTKSGSWITTYKGYEIIRLHSRPKSAESGTLSDLANRFYISEAIARKLVSGKEIKEPAKNKIGKVVLQRGQMAEFFDRVYPVYGSAMYRQLESSPTSPLLNHIPYHRRHTV